MATILLLALTVTLFASIFAFVTTFPTPPAQNNNQFQATLNYTASGTLVAGIQIVHLAGPSVPGTAQVYLKSATQPSAPEFSSPLDPYSVSSGLGGATTWNLGQVWKLTFAAGNQPTSLGNITIYVVSGSQLIFSVILPGAAVSIPPTVVSTWVSPANPTVGQAFTVNATLSGSYTSRSVYVNLGSVPGASSPAEVKMTQNGQGVWGFVVKAGNTTKNGTFYAFVNATSSSGQTATGAVVITILSTGGGGSNGPLSVGVILVPAPPNSGVTESVQAVVTYTGAASGAALSVTFSGTSSPSGFTYSGTGPSGLTISGPASETVVSQTTWTIPNPSTLYTYTLTATATVSGVGTVTGTTSFEPPTVTDAPASGAVGTSVTLTGSAFSSSAGSAVNFTLGGVAATISTCSAGTISSNTVVPTAAGGFVCTITVPNGAPSGATLILANDIPTGQADTAAYSVTAQTLIIGPTTGLVGSTATARGANFAYASPVRLVMDGVTITPSGSSNGTCSFSGPVITTTATGTFVCRFTIPVAAGAGAATLYANSTAYASESASASYTVTSWTISPLSVTTGVQATSVTVTATGFAPSSSVTLAFDAISVTVTSCSVGTAGSPITTTAGGAFTCVFPIPYGSPAGAGSLLATDSTSGQTASAPFTVTSWTFSSSPASLAHGTSQALTLAGSGFAVSSTIQIYYNGAIITPSSCSSGTITGTNTIVTTAAGAFSCTYTMPTQGSAGTYLFQVIDITSGQTFTLAFVRS